MTPSSVHLCDSPDLQRSEVYRWRGAGSGVGGGGWAGWPGRSGRHGEKGKQRGGKSEIQITEGSASNVSVSPTFLQGLFRRKRSLRRSSSSSSSSRQQLRQQQQQQQLSTYLYTLIQQIYFLTFRNKFLEAGFSTTIK